MSPQRITAGAVSTLLRDLVQQEMKKQIGDINTILEKEDINEFLATDGKFSNLV
jgi:hypothetical protein